MLLKILLLQVLSMGLITLPTQAQEASVDEIPELFMTDSDKAFMDKIWNIAGYTNDGKTGPFSEVERKFFGNMYGAAAMPGYFPMIPYPMMPGVPGMATMPGMHGMPAYLGNVQQNLQNQQQKSIIQKGTTNTGSPTTINYRVQPKPPNSELDSSEEDESLEGDVESTISTSGRSLYPKNVEWKITDEETDPGYVENEERMERMKENEELQLEKMQRRMQFERTNVTKVDTPRRTLEIRRLKNHRTSKNNNPTTLSSDIETSRQHHEQNTTANKNTHRETQRNNNNERKHYMHKKKYYRKTTNATRNASKRKESNRKPDKSLETRKYYEMLENSQKYMCKCNRNEEKHRRNNEELRYDQVFNCTEYCSATERKDTKTNDKANGRLRSRRDKDREHVRERYHKAKRENDGEEEDYRPKTTHSRRHRNKHRNHEYNTGSDRGSTEGYFYSTSTEAEEMVNDENDEIYLPNEKQFAQNAEYRSSIDPVEAYAEESAYRHRYPEEVEYDPMRRYEDEPDYGTMEMDPINGYDTSRDYQPIISEMNVDYRSLADTGMTKHETDSYEYMAWFPIEVLHNGKDYNPMIHQYPYNPRSTINTMYREK